MCQKYQTLTKKNQYRMSMSRIKGFLSPVSIRTCLPSSQCGFTGSINTEQGRIWTQISCCNIDNCTPTIPLLPSVDSSFNGKVCPTCISTSSTSCASSNTMQCTGNENSCLLQSTQSTGLVPLLGIRGCATKNLCDLGTQTFDVTGVNMQITFSCYSGSTSGSTSVHKVLLTPAVVCLLLLKWFFQHQ
ncbi:phospholipase A2 inhibitor and Ly6/PLAUR domain-containing protein-like [Anomaloglossus baeobatrachus]|uniref:phospholipase A2 inhibitor and Ly6/PLAUR domain-containing protein-like n=1 Tax=Anomaloglossus baeobatrachus TaxID=238106 RepID=UPI003F505773